MHRTAAWAAVLLFACADDATRAPTDTAVADTGTPADTAATDTSAPADSAATTTAVDTSATAPTDAATTDTTATTAPDTATADTTATTPTDAAVTDTTVVDTAIGDTTEPGPVRAFPGAEGFGASVTGGRGGQVIKVTTLAASGPGSLQAALSTPGPRIIVFAVSGVIRGDLLITEPDVTIAGQTAPGAGITIAGTLYTPYCDRDVRNIIVRHVRVRHLCSDDDNTQCDAMQFSCASDFILDHVSVSWGIDENLDLYDGAHTFTVQDSVFEAPCLGPPGSEFGGYHNYGLLNGPGGGRGTVLRTAFINSKARNPALADGPQEVVNTLVYSFRLGLIHNNPASGDFNVVGNYYRKGPDLEVPGGSAPIAKPFYFDDEEPDSGPTRYHFADNTLDDWEEPLGAFDDPFTADHSNLGADEMLASPSQAVATPFDFTSNAGYVAPVVAPSGVVPTVLWPRMGAFPQDVVSRESLADVADGTGRFGCPRRAAQSADLLAGLTPTAAPADGDGDGMPDAWEAAHGLDPATPDATELMPSGYTAIEAWINEVADALVAP